MSSPAGCTPLPEQDDPGGAVTIVLGGDVMLGRGVDQVLPHPGDPGLHEPVVHDARHYVELAERVNGAIPAPVSPAWPWGAALSLLDAAAPDVLVLNLETAVTTSDALAPDKPVRYRMHPDNLTALLVARPDVCVLANNHVLDHGAAGLRETLAVLHGAGLRTVGAGVDRASAQGPAAVPLPSGGRVLVAAVGMPSSGIPPSWAATDTTPGVAYVPGPTAAAADTVLELLAAHQRADDILVVSIHWGSNWGYDVAADQVRFAHALVDGGVDLVHGHSSHHPRPVERYHDRLVLYGCGDLIDDYEGIAGYEQFRDDLRVLYVVRLARDSGALLGLRLHVLRAQRMRLCDAPSGDVAWLARRLDRASRSFDCRFDVAPDGALDLVGLQETVGPA